VKLVIAVIQPPKLQAVREALDKVEVMRMTICDAQGFAPQRARAERPKRNPREPRVLRKVALEVFVNDDFLERTVETIVNVARTGPEGSFGDGKIFIVPAEEAVQISDGGRGPGSV